MDKKELTAPCGLPCFACTAYVDNITDEVAQQVSKQMGIPAEDAPCHGCRSEKGCSIRNVMGKEEGCPTKNCVEKKGLHNCSECSELPCENLMPASDWANLCPHNTKLYNLTRMRLIGHEKWTEEAAEIWQKYFDGKFVYGTGPKLNQ